jgi:hypothetical protein
MVDARRHLYFFFALSLSLSLDNDWTLMEADPTLHSLG